MSSPLPAAESQAGPLLITYFFCWILFGVLSSQVFTYYINFRSQDRVFLRLLVFVVYALEVAHTVLLFVACYGLFARKWGDMDALLSWSGAWTELPLIGSTIMALAQGLYVYRIWILGRSSQSAGSRRRLILVVCAIALIVLVQYAMMIAETVHLRLTADEEFRTRESFIFSITWASSGLACSVMIVCSMFWTLRRKEIRSQDTLVIVSNILYIVVCTGSLIATLAILTLIFMLVPKTGGAVLVTIGISPNVTSCSMMALLNARRRWKDDRKGVPVNVSTGDRPSPSAITAMANICIGGNGLTASNCEDFTLSDPIEEVAQANGTEKIVNEGAVGSSSTRLSEQLGGVQVKTEIVRSAE